MTDRMVRLTAALAGRYRVEREIGAGGMATVYLAEDLKHQRQVAVKVLRPELAAALGHERFLREIGIAASLQHPHVLPLFDSGEADGFLFYVMPYIDGSSLREKLDEEGALPIPDAVRILRDVADALAEAHRSGVVHRDLKPENVMLRGRHALVTDFGVAKAVGQATTSRSLTTAGMALGTLTYMSPEQASADPNVDHRTDIYAFGVVAYELLVGQPPFVGLTPVELLGAHITKPPHPVTDRRPAIPAGLAEVVMRCLAKEPADRWQSADELIPRLEAALTPGSGTIAVAPRRRGPRVTRRATGWALGLAAALAAAVLGWQLMGRPESPSAATPTTSVAVLPLVNEGADADQEYLADGIADGLISALSKVPGLKVASRNSAFRLKSSPLSVRQKADTLGVATILEGSMRRGLGRIRVTLQLLNASDGLARWTETYDRPAADLMAVQDDIVQQVAAALRLELGGVALAVSRAGRSVDPQAHDLFLRGRFWYDRGTEEGCRRALDFFQQAVAKDSTFAAAYASIATAWICLAARFEPPAPAYANAKAAARAALALDSLLPEAHAALGNASLNSWDGLEAERHLRRAVELDPRSADVNFGYAVYLGVVGKWQQGLQAVDQAIAVSPFEAMPSFMRSMFFFFSRQYDSTIVQDRRTQELLPGFLYEESLGALALIALGRFDEATAEYDRLQTLHPGTPLYGPVAILAKTGRLAEARAQLRQLERNPAATPFHLAWLAAVVGEPDRALALLEQMLSRGDVHLLHWNTSPLLDPLRSDPRFVDLVRRVHEAAGLPAPEGAVSRS